MRLVVGKGWPRSIIKKVGSILIMISDLRLNCLFSYYRKRAVSASPFQPSAALLAIWKPLLAHLQALHPSLQSILVSKIIAGLLREPEAVTSAEIETISLDISGRERDPSYDMCIASWAFWLITAFNAASVDPDDETARIEEAAVALITGLGPIPDTSVDTKASVFRFLPRTMHSLPSN